MDFNTFHKDTIIKAVVLSRWIKNDTQIDNIDAKRDFSSEYNVLLKLFVGL